ncbi:hypothetical protein ACQEVF_34140 [Nonomuraea polychroma]
MSGIWVEPEHQLPDDFEPPNMSALPPPTRPERERCANCGKCPRCGL